MLRIAVDLDGTIMEYTEIYKELVEALINVGHEIYIMTGRESKTLLQDKAQLFKLGVGYTKFINTSDFNGYERQLESWSEQGHISIDRDEIVCMWKAREIAERGFDIVFDDAADKIRLYLDVNDHEVLLLKSPTDFNQVFTKWGRKHFVEYLEETGVIK